MDGNPEDHDVRRHPATYERILRNISGCKVNIHWTVVRKNIVEPGYMDRYLAFWNDRPEANNIWVSVYTPQLEEESPERLTETDRRQLNEYFLSISGKYPKLTMHKGLMDAFLEPPTSPSTCLFSKLSVKLHRRFENPRGTVRLRRSAQLRGVRLLHQHGLALARRHESSWSASGATPDQRLFGDWRNHQSRAQSTARAPLEQ